MGRKIEIPKDIWKRLSKRADKKGFDTCEDYIINVLRQVKEKLERQEDKKEEDTEKVSKEEEEKVKKRLKALGYG